jgi:2-polyprenyl-3-methyl-5-hydroxy-6-metoxy-1,4-benzoquinol methylase
MSDSGAPDIDAVRSYAFTLYTQLSGFLLTGTVWVGVHLGLYRAMAGAGPVSADGLAAATGLHPRWVLEWMRAQGAAGLLRHAGDEHFELPPEGAAVLVDEDHLFYAGGTFGHIPLRAAQLADLPESFRTGLGHTWDDRGAEGAAATEGLFRNWYRTMLVPVMLPALDGVAERLRHGARVADVGCGAGVALIETAKAFPSSEFHGYEVSERALERADANRAAVGLTNVTFHHAADDPLPADGSFDLVMTLDCVHDMTRPTEVVAALRRAVADDGTWLWAEPKALPSFEENVERNPMVAMMYATSLTSCMSSAMSEPGGEGLGTLGIPETRARAMAAAAGFTRFEVHDFDNPVNVYFEVRP